MLKEPPFNHNSFTTGNAKPILINVEAIELIGMGTGTFGENYLHPPEKLVFHSLKYAYGQALPACFSPRHWR
jgi:hypothetical protein